LRPLASSSSYMDRRRSHVAAGPSVRLGLWDAATWNYQKVKSTEGKTCLQG
jgi:hypothetical protein